MLLVTAILVVVLSLAGWLVYARTTGALEAELRSRISEDFTMMQDAQSRAGEQGLAQFINWALATRSSEGFAFGMFTEAGDHLSGNLTTLPAFEGWGQITAAAGDASSPKTLIGYAGEIGDHIVVVAHSNGIVSTTGNTVLEALLIAGLVIAMTSLGTGYVVSRGTSQRLHRLAQTLGSVAGGNSDIRLPVSPRNDQIDFVSRQINGYLDRLAELMTGMRNTAIAIAHDLKTPLNRVSILLQNAETAQDPDQIRGYLDKIHDELDGLKSVLDTILRISRIEASDDTSTFAQIDLTDMARDLVQTFEPVLEEQGQTIRFIEPQASVSPTFGDRRMLQQLIVNLIENAGRYAGPAARVAVSVTQGDAAPVVTVVDDGPGIPADKREAVFEPFFRMNPERDELGTGLGLAMVKAIANRHRATIELDDNNPGLVVRLILAPRTTVEMPPSP
jgi:signal transduction histidine kinase